MDAFEMGKFVGGCLGWTVDTSVNVTKATMENTVIFGKGVVAQYNSTNRNEVTTVAEIAAVAPEAGDFVPTAQQMVEIEEFLAKMAAGK